VTAEEAYFADSVKLHDDLVRRFFRRPAAWLARPSRCRLMVGRPACRTPRLRSLRDLRRVDGGWPRLTKRASRSANKALAERHPRTAGSESPPFFFLAIIELWTFASCATSSLSLRAALHAGGPPRPHYSADTEAIRCGCLRRSSASPCSGARTAALSSRILAASSCEKRSACLRGPPTRSRLRSPPKRASWTAGCGMRTTTAYAGLLGMLQLYLPTVAAGRYPSARVAGRDAVVTVEQGNADVGLVVPYFESSLLARETVMELALLAALRIPSAGLTGQEARLEVGYHETNIGVALLDRHDRIADPATRADGYRPAATVGGRVAASRAGRRRPLSVRIPQPAVPSWPASADCAAWTASAAPASRPLRFSQEDAAGCVSSTRRFVRLNRVTPSSFSKQPHLMAQCRLSNCGRGGPPA